MRPTGDKRAYRSLKRDAEAGKTRARILNAAARHLRARGPRSLSLESIAEQAGVTRVTVYKQFGSRWALLEAVFDQVAAQGGLHRIPTAMADPDARGSLQQIVAIFCDFWDYNRKTIPRMLSAAATEPRLAAAIRSRNERRRTIIATILQRMAGVEQVPPETFNEVVDVLFVLMSHPVFAELQGTGRSVEAVCRLIQELAIRTLDRLKV